MTVHLSFRHRRVLCKRCRRPFAARSSVCPHCGTDRKKLRSKSSRVSVGVVIAVVLVVMLIGGYMLMRETGLDARIKAMSAHRTISHASALRTIEYTLANHGMKTALRRSQSSTRGA